MKLHLKSWVSLSRVEDGCRSASSEAASTEKPRGEQSCESSAVPASCASHTQHGERTELLQVVQKWWRTNPNKSPWLPGSYFTDVELWRQRKMWTNRRCGCLGEISSPWAPADNIATFRSRREGHGPAAGGLGQPPTAPGIAAEMLFRKVLSHHRPL